MLNFDLCNQESTLSCIEGIWAIDPSGKRIDGELVRPILFDQKQAVDENIPLNLPKSTAHGFLFRLPAVTNSLGSEGYYVATHVSMFKGKSEKSFTYGEINTGLRPVRELQGNYSQGFLLPTSGSGGGKNRTPDGSECVAVETGTCLESADFPAGYRFGVTIRIGEKLRGWFHGRISLPTISIADWKKGMEISIEAEPVKIPTIDFMVPPAVLSEKMKDVFSKNGCGRGLIDGQCQTGSNLSHPDAMELVKLFAPAYGDKATKSQTVWNFKNMFNHAGSINTYEIDRCTPNTSSLSGLVLTNSLTYSAGPPSYDAQTGSLVYKVASPHLEANGEVAQGTYDLSIRSEVARCIYGFSSAPIKAEISIAGEDGEKRVATTIVNEKDGWLYLTARGFTYSAPVITVKLSQDQVKKEEKTGTAAKVSTIKKKATSITCTKGKVTKKFVGANAKCPKGYLKK
jgi:hypothetical protein